ncbi:hypothetical protein Tco_1555756 [Tanacetum coccineum]
MPSNRLDIVIKDIYVVDGNFGSYVKSNVSGGIWKDIIKAAKLIEDIDISFKYYFTRKISSGGDRMFQKNFWCGDDKLATLPNLLSCGVDISSTTSPFCDCNMEGIEHCLIKGSSSSWFRKRVGVGRILSLLFPFPPSPSPILLLKKLKSMGVLKLQRLVMRSSILSFGPFGSGKWVRECHLRGEGKYFGGRLVSIYPKVLQALVFCTDYLKTSDLECLDC